MGARQRGVQAGKLEALDWPVRPCRIGHLEDTEFQDRLHPPRRASYLCGVDVYGKLPINGESGSLWIARRGSQR